MSGQPYKYASDQERFRNEYMENLNMTIENNDKTLQAVKLYVQNGTLPAVSQIQDNRTTAEKLLDINGIKSGIISDFKPIMDASIAQSLIAGVIQSPLNIDNKLLLFLAQRAPEIAKELTKLYKYKIKGDSNDIFTFVEFINNMYAKKNNATASMKSFVESGYVNRGGGGMVNRDELVEFDVFLTNLLSRISSKTVMGDINYNTSVKYKERDLNKPYIEPAINMLVNHNHLNELERVRRKINDLIAYIPTIGAIGILNHYVRNGIINGINDAGLDDALNVFEWMKQALPNKDFLSSLGSSLASIIDDAMRNGINKDDNLISEYIQRIWELIPRVPPNLPHVNWDQIEHIDLGGGGGENVNTQPPNNNVSLYGNVSYANPINQPDFSQTSNAEPISSISSNARLLPPESSYPLYTPHTMGSNKPNRGTVINEHSLQHLGMGGLDLEIAQIDRKINELENLPPSEYGDENMHRHVMIRDLERVKRDLIDKASSSNRGLTSTQSPSELSTPSRRSEKQSPSSDGTTLLDIQHHNVPISNEKEIQKLLEYRRKMLEHFDKQWKKEGSPAELPYSLKHSASIQIDRNTQQLIDLGIKPDMLDKIDSSTFKSFIGNGLRRRGRPSGRGINVPIPVENNIDHTQGITESLKFSPFGKYLIHNGKLRDNVISLKNIKGGNVIGLPSNKVSIGFGKVVKSIIGGSLPSYNDMDKLTDEEKKYLYLISSKANIVDKLNIPTPSKDAEDKDLHLFEVYKGELMAGNDSKELIHKFKALLLKLSKNGSLPKQQVNEILNEILQLGF